MDKEEGQDADEEEEMEEKKKEEEEEEEEEEECLVTCNRCEVFKE